MAEKNQILDMSPIGMVFTVVKSKEDTDRKSLDLEWELLPKCNMIDPLYHVHPEAIETYHILEGEMELEGYNFKIKYLEFLEKLN